MKWFRKRPSRAERMEDHRIDLIQKRTKLEEDIVPLENREALYLQQGKTSTSTLQKRRLAAYLAQLRKDIARHRQSIAIFNQQINVHATNLHNKEIIATAKAAQLPSAEELTDHAVRAEEMLETLSADADMVNGFGTNSVSLSDEEAAIMREFEQEETETETETETEAEADDLECESLHTDKYPVNRGSGALRKLKEEMQ